MNRLWILVIVLIVIAILALALADVYRPLNQPYWEATYCSEEDCPPDSESVPRWGLLSDREDRTCPETKRVTVLGTGQIKFRETYYLMKGSCRVVYPFGGG